MTDRYYAAGREKVPKKDKNSHYRNVPWAWLEFGYIFRRITLRFKRVTRRPVSTRFASMVLGVTCESEVDAVEQIGSPSGDFVVHRMFSDKLQQLDSIRLVEFEPCFWRRADD